MIRLGVYSMEKISIIMIYNNILGYKNESFVDTVQSLREQNYNNWELVIADERGKNAHLPHTLKNDKVTQVPVDFKNRANSLNRAIEHCNGEYIILVNNDQAQIIFRSSMLETFLFVAKRHDNAGIIYADYRLVNDDNSEKDIHLLNYHQGRLRDNFDFGSVLFFPKKVLYEICLFNEKFEAAYLYDLRLRISQKYEIIHIAAKQNGHLYEVKMVAKSHNVFDYLMAGKDVQLEMENALTEHLKRTDIYLSPAQNYHKIEYTPEEEKKFQDCIASVVIPVFNREEFIATAIESVQAQTVQNVEIIIGGNGGKHDHTIKAIHPDLPGGVKYDPAKPTESLISE